MKQRTTAIRVRALVTATVVTVFATGCAAPSSDSGAGALAQLSGARLGQDVRLLRNEDDAAALARLIDARLGAPLSAATSVQIALLNHRGLQATYWNVGIAEADLLQAGRLQNPSFTFQRTHQGDAADFERSITLNLARILTAPLAQRIEARRFEQTTLLVAQQMLLHAAETQRAYFDAVAAAQAVAYARQLSAAAQASAELTARMNAAGSASQLELAREQASDAEFTAALARADRRALAAREKLTRQMGLWGANAQYTLPERLPDLPPTPARIDDIERIAVRDRLDVRAAKIEAEQTAASLGLNRATRLVNVLDFGYLRNGASGAPAATGYAITLELPLFDWGTARVAKSEAIYMQSLNKVAQVATDARSAARESYLDYRIAHDLAAHYRDRVIPLRKKISDETLLRYNGMLISAFELLADARDQAGAVTSQIEALRDYWIAQTNLEAALGGQLPAAPTNETQEQQP
jgi:outer membrane protein TolC